MMSFQWPHRAPTALSAGALALLLGGLAICPGSAAAQETDDETRARAHHEAAVALFDQGRYAEAVGEFRQAHALSGRSHVLLNVARSLELAGDQGAAADALDEYLAAEPDAEDAEALRVRSAELRRRASTVTPDPDEAPAEPEPALEASSAPATAQDTWVGPVVLLSLAAGTFVAAGVTGGLALDLHASVSARCGADGRCPEETRADIDRGVALTLAADVLLGGGALLAAVGVVWWIVAEAEAGEAPPVTAGAACDRAGCLASVRGSFE